jgi:acetyl-CoA carboxylase beta subunit
LSAAIDAISVEIDSCIEHAENQLELAGAEASVADHAECKVTEPASMLGLHKPEVVEEDLFQHRTDTDLLCACL